MQDKLFLPGLQKLKLLRDRGFFGRMLSVRGDFGYWVFEGDWGQPAQRPSWNYRAEDGGGIILDMICHWRYVLDNLFGEVKSVSCIGATHIPERVDERRPALCGDGRRRGLCDVPARWRGDREHQHVLVHAGLSRRSRDLPGRRNAWVRRRRADRLRHAAEGRDAASGLEPGPETDHRLLRHLAARAGQCRPDNGFKTQWEMFIRHVAEDAPYKYTLREGAKGVQLVECALESWRERRWVDVPPLDLGARTPRTRWRRNRAFARTLPMNTLTIRLPRADRGMESFQPVRPRAITRTRRRAR